MSNEEKLDKLEKKYRGFKNNINICYIAIAYLVYSTLTEMKEAPIYFFFAMGAIIIALFLLSMRAKKSTLVVKAEIEELISLIQQNEEILQ